MYKTRLIWACLCLLSAGLPTPSCAETLDDTAIHKFYNNMAAATNDPDKLRQFMEEGFADSYVLKLNSSQSVGSRPPDVTMDSFSKMEAIENIMNTFSNMQMQDYKANIDSITVAPDKKSAEVHTTTMTAGLMSFPTETGNDMMVRFEDQKACNDKVGLTGTKVQLTESSCKENLVVKR